MNAQPEEGEALFKPFVDEIIVDAPCPLLIVASHDGEPDQDGGELPLRHILLPVRGTEGDRRAAEVAFWLARADDDIIVDVVHVVSRPEHETRVDEDESLAEAVEIGEQLVEDIAELGHSMGATVHTEVLVADQTMTKLVEYATDRADLIVLSSDRRSASQRAFLGHGTEYVLREAPCPVAIVNYN